MADLIAYRPVSRKKAPPAPTAAASAQWESRCIQGDEFIPPLGYKGDVAGDQAAQ